MTLVFSPSVFGINLQESIKRIIKYSFVSKSESAVSRPGMDVYRQEIVAVIHIYTT